MWGEVVARQMQSTRGEILSILKRRGGMTASALSDTLGITPMGVRRHLTVLEKDGLITYRPVQRGVGRPSYVYTLTPLADELFPRTYPQLIAQLLDTLSATDGPQKVETLFADRAQRLAAEHEPRLDGKDLAGRVAELAHVQDENGYVAEWERLDDDALQLTEHNCAVSQVAACYPQVCFYELALFQALLDARVDRTRHILNGDGVCCYNIRRKT